MTDTKFQVGDKVCWCGSAGIVKSINMGPNSLVEVDFGQVDWAPLFYSDGKVCSWNKEPSLFFVERPKKMVKKKMWVQSYGKNTDGTFGGGAWGQIKYDHQAYETELGIPEWLARVEDTLFEGMAEEKSRTWPKHFLAAIPTGINLEQIKTPFIIFILKKCLASLDECQFDPGKFTDVKKAVEGSRSAIIEMIRCHENSIDLSAAESAAWAAYDQMADELLRLLEGCK